MPATSSASDGVRPHRQIAHVRDAIREASTEDLRFRRSPRRSRSPRCSVLQVPTEWFLLPQARGEVHKELPRGGLTGDTKFRPTRCDCVRNRLRCDCRIESTTKSVRIFWLMRVTLIGLMAIRRRSSPQSKQPRFPTEAAHHLPEDPVARVFQPVSAPVKTRCHTWSRHALNRLLPPLTPFHYRINATTSPSN